MLSDIVYAYTNKGAMLDRPHVTFLWCDKEAINFDDKEKEWSLGALSGRLRMSPNRSKTACPRFRRIVR